MRLQCDGCPQRATNMAVPTHNDVAGQSLLFCTHCGIRHEEALEAAGFAMFPVPDDDVSADNSLMETVKE